MKEIKLGGKRANGNSALVDDALYDELNKYNWWCNSNGYAVRIEYRKGKYYKQHYMHKVVIGEVPTGMQVDHINRNILDNRRENLRIATYSENQMNRTTLSSNTTGYKGVSFDKKSNKYRSYIIKDGVQLNLGFYENKEDAAKAYNVKAIELYGEFVLLNDVEHGDFELNRKLKRHSKHRGVTLQKQNNTWYANVRVGGKTVHLGTFKNENDAARMYNFWANDLFGEYAHLNEINGKKWEVVANE